MNSQDQEFILQNRRKLSTRQIAKKLGIERREVEKFLESARPESSSQQAEEKSAGFSKPSLWLPLLIFFMALAIRLLYIYGLRGTPFFEPLSSKLDDGVYLQIATAISRGNWLADIPFSAYRMPLYPYFLAVLLRFFGESITAIHAVQALAGAGSAALVYLLTLTMFHSKRAALIAGVIAAAYLPFVFFEHLILGETLSILLNLLSLYLLVRALAVQKFWMFFFALSGLFLGLSCLLRPNTVLAFVALCLALAWSTLRKSGPVKEKRIAVIVFGLFALLAILPSGLRNYHLHKDFVPLSALGGVNLFIGNNPEADGKFTFAKGIGTSLDEMLENSIKTAEKESGRALKPSEVSSFWTRRAVQFMTAHPGQVLRLLAVKISFFFNQYEFPDILDIYFVSQFLPFLKFHSFSYGILVMLGFCGIFLAWKRRMQGALLPGAFYAGYVLSVVLFFVSARYRLPSVPILIAFASYALGEGILSAEGRKKTGPVFAGIALVTGLVAFRPVEITNFATNYNSLGIALKNKGQFKEAEKYYLKATEIAPEYPSPYYNLSLLMEKTGRIEEAASYRARFEKVRGQYGA